MKQTVKKQQSKAKKALEGHRLVITRNKEQSGVLKKKLEALGGEVLELPLIKVSPYCDPDTLDEVFKEIGGYEWIAFSSANGVKYFFEFFFKRFKDLRCLGGMRIACIGVSTAMEVEKLHLQVDFIPKESVAEKFAKELIESECLDNEKILVITGNLNRDVLVKKLEDEGRAIVDRVQVYQTEENDVEKEKSVERFRKEGADAILFTSSSTVNSFVRQAKALQLEPKAKKPLACSIGPITSQTMREKGLSIDLEAREHSIDGLIEALVEKVG